MTGRTHFVIGLNAVWVVPLIGPVDISALPLLFLGGLAGLLPDIDAPEAEIHEVSRNVTKIFFVHKVFGHRKFFHSMFLVGAMLLALIYLAGRFHPAIPWVVAAGYASHLLIDGFNTKGVAYLWPWGEMIYLSPPFLRCRVGGWIDDALFVVGIGGVAIFLDRYGRLMWESLATLWT